MPPNKSHKHAPEKHANQLKYALLGPHSRVNVDNRLFRFDSKTPQRFLGLAALLGAGYTLFCILWPLRYSLLLTWGVIELIFYVLYYRPRYAELNEQPAKHEPKALDGLKTFHRFLRFCTDLPNGVDYRAYFSGWFKGVEFEEIKRGNAEEFMAYGFWYRTREQMTDAGLGDVPSQMVDQLEATWGFQFEPGYNSNIQFMGHLWEPLNANFRPLAFYLATEAVGWFARTLLKRWGFEHHKHNGLSYFTLNVPKPKQAPTSYYSRATSSSTLADMAAAAATPGVTAPTVPGSATAACQAQQQADATRAMQQPTAAGPAGVCVQPCGSFSRGPSSGSSGSFSSSASSLARSRSSPFEAGPPDWTPFNDPGAVPAQSPHSALFSDLAAGGPCAAPSAAGSSGSESSGHQQLQHPCPPADRAGLNKPAGRVHHFHRHTSPQLFSGLSTQTSLMLRSTINPLQGALSEGLGSADTPVLFLHGVGGLPAYLEMILHVIGLGHPVIAVEFRGVSMRLGRVYTADEVADTVAGVLDKLGVKEACVVGHSYGTFVAGYLARHHPRRVHTLCLIDPVCFGMFMPHLLYNFLYRIPTPKGWTPHDFVEFFKDAGRLVASRELHVFTTFARRFYWSDLNIWPEDLAPGSVVLLSGQDDLMDAAEVKDMLDVAGHVKVYYNHDLSHGAFLLDTEVKQTIMAEMRTLLARSGSAVVGLARPVLERTLTLMTHGFTHGGAPGNVSMKKGGGNGRYYVEDHGNQLVRTFTGNLTKMLASIRRSSSSGGEAAAGINRAAPHPAGGAFSAGGALGGPSRLAAGSNEVAGGGGGWGTGRTGGFSGGGAAATAAAGFGGSRLMQTFSGPVRRRFSSGFSSVSNRGYGFSGGGADLSSTPAVDAAAAKAPCSQKSAGGHVSDGGGVDGVGAGSVTGASRQGSSGGGGRGASGRWDGSSGPTGIADRIDRIDEGQDEAGAE